MKHVGTRVLLTALFPLFGPGAVFMTPFAWVAKDEWFEDTGSRRAIPDREPPGGRAWGEGKSSAIR